MLTSMEALHVPSVMVVNSSPLRARPLHLIARTAALEREVTAMAVVAVPALKAVTIQQQDNLVSFVRKGNNLKQQEPPLHRLVSHA